jgi:formylglycine-generating enzyme required for sulfatase activity
LDVDPSRLVGGVWEWCRDEEGDGHVIRGGCWLNAVDGTPTTDLRSVQGRVPDETIGFRTVIRIPPQRIP